MTTFPQGRYSWAQWTPEQLVTVSLTIKEAANKAGVRVVLGFERIYINDKPVAYGQWRQVLGEMLFSKTAKS